MLMKVVVSQNESDRSRLAERLKGSNVNPNTFLATDYLNHFNEVMMLLEMIPDMPDMIEEIADWKPKTYCDHFSESGIADRELAVEAYILAPQQYRLPFDLITEKLDNHLLETINRAIDHISNDDLESLSASISEAIPIAQKLWSGLNAIIHGDNATVDQASIDSFLADDIETAKRA